MKKAYILGGFRSYIGVENGMYRHIPAERLGASVLRQMLERMRLPEPELVIAGNGVGAGGNIARLMTLEAGLSEKVPAFTIDLQCASGLESLAAAAAKIQCGQADFVIAGGFESSSTAPRRAYNRNHPDYKKYGAENSWYPAAKFMPGEHTAMAMLEGAERTALAEKITREEMDPWVLRSHRLAAEAEAEGRFKNILIEVAAGCNRDEGIRPRMSQRLLDRLPCVLKNGQMITAANACLTHDGAAFLALCSEEYAARLGAPPKAEFIDAVEVGGDPSMSPKTAIEAVSRLLEKRRLSDREIQVFECNEAFAVIDVLFARKFPDSVCRYNLSGGALAYGHPYGASGGIITLHALEALEKAGGGLAVCSAAAAGGVGTAILIKGFK